MANFTFPCPKCGQPIEADHEWHGQNAPCPHCSETIMIPFGVKLSVPASKKKSLSLTNVLLAAALLLAIGVGICFFTSNAKSTPSTPTLSTKGSSLNLTMKLVTNENQDVTPFSRVIIFPYEPSWDERVKIFEACVAMSKILKSTYGVTEAQLAESNSDAAAALRMLNKLPQPTHQGSYSVHNQYLLSWSAGHKPQVPRR